jgi:hypothetical protein
VRVAGDMAGDPQVAAQGDSIGRGPGTRDVGASQEAPQTEHGPGNRVARRPQPGNPPHSGSSRTQGAEADSNRHGDVAVGRAANGSLSSFEPPGASRLAELRPNGAFRTEHRPVPQPWFAPESKAIQVVKSPSSVKSKPPTSPPGQGSILAYDDESPAPAAGDRKRRWSKGSPDQSPRRGRKER